MPSRINTESSKNAKTSKRDDEISLTRANRWLWRFSSLGLTNEIRRCTKCIDQRYANKDRLVTSEKPFVKFNVWKKWKPDGNVTVLFVAESPPWNGKQRYFCNLDVVEKRTNLRKEVLKYLKLESLKDFRTRGYFLTDAVKCRLNKSRKPNVPSKVLKTCADYFLKREIIDLKPETIFVLGNSAKQALSRFPEFRELENHKITDDFDMNLSGYCVILCVYPGAQNGAHINQIKRSFAKITRP